jgi:hypothetical protein
MFGFLCKLGLHEWRYEDAIVTSLDEHEGVWIANKGNLPGRTPPFEGQSEHKIEAEPTKRECMRCGIKQVRKFSEDDEGNKTIISDWEETA